MAKFVDDSKKFVREVRAEMSKVTWPSWPELKGSTILVIIVSVFFALYIGAVDVLLSFIRNIWI